MPEAKPLNVILPEDLKAQFVNMVRIAHTPGEFVLDFIAVLPGVEDPKVSTRVVLSPLGLRLMTCSKHKVHHLPQRTNNAATRRHLQSDQNGFRQKNSPARCRAQ
jgi:hypothetical protein